MGGMGMHAPHQLTPHALPVAAPPYLGVADRGARRRGPIEPWKDSAAADDVRVGRRLARRVRDAARRPSPLAFNWDVIIHGEEHGEDARRS